mmetsp:Transcript_28099/g.71860  ORF Transcript_28099/g.71860 Transcript_28099/m.71860 type:complete len:141 (+) Transcript_28099:280-702(+)
MPPKKNGRKAKWTEERHQLAADARARREILENDATHGPSWEPLATDEHERAAADAELDMEMAEAVVSDDDQPMALATGVDFDPGATRRRLRNSELHRRARKCTKAQGAPKKSACSVVTSGSPYDCMTWTWFFEKVLCFVS